jgi:hypothetical protein
VIQANISSAEGLSRYFFSESGYEAGHEFTPVKGWGWKYELVRDHGNAPSTMTIHCHTQSFTVPIPAGMSMRDNGGGIVDAISATCKKVEAISKSSKPRTPAQ